VELEERTGVDIGVKPGKLLRGTESAIALTLDAALGRLTQVS